MIKCPYCRNSDNVKAVEYIDTKLPQYYRQAVCMRCGYLGIIPKETYEKLLKRRDKNDKHSS